MPPRPGRFCFTIRKMDKRSSKTLAKIYEGFSICLQKSPYSLIKVRDIIRQAKISPTGFYAHFKTKDEVLRGLLANVFLTVKCSRLEAKEEERISLLFVRMDINAPYLISFLPIQDNCDLLRNAFLPWCRTFLPNTLSKQRKSLASSFVADSLIAYLKADEKEGKMEIQDALKMTINVFIR